MKWGNNLEYTEAATGCVFKEKEITCARVSFLVKLQA